MEHQGWKIEVRYEGYKVWYDYYNPEHFQSKKSLESCVRRNLNSGKYGREYRVVEKFPKQEGE